MDDLERNSIRYQNNLKRALVVTLTEAIAAAIEHDLRPENAFKALEEVMESERRLELSRQANERTYA